MPGSAVLAAKTEVRFAILLDTTIEEAWAATFIRPLDRVAKKKPHGLTVSYKYVENISTTNAERVMKSFANTKKYDILLFHSGQYQDAVNAIGEQYPKELVVVSGSGYKPKGGNILHLDTYAHEPAYLMGMMAGMMTKKNMVGAVAAFPYSNINLPVNAFFAGAKSVNPECKQVVTYLETWFDPAKAKESAAAQIAAGADFIFAERFGVFEAAREAASMPLATKRRICRRSRCGAFQRHFQMGRGFGARHRPVVQQRRQGLQNPSRNLCGHHGRRRQRSGSLP